MRACAIPFSSNVPNKFPPNARAPNCLCSLMEAGPLKHAVSWHLQRAFWKVSALVNLPHNGIQRGLFRIGACRYAWMKCKGRAAGVEMKVAGSLCHCLCRHSTGHQRRGQRRRRRWCSSRCRSMRSLAAGAGMPARRLCWVCCWCVCCACVMPARRLRERYWCLLVLVQ